MIRSLQNLQELTEIACLFSAKKWLLRGYYCCLYRQQGLKTSKENLRRHCLCKNKFSVWTAGAWSWEIVIMESKNFTDEIGHIFKGCDFFLIIWNQLGIGVYSFQCWPLYEATISNWESSSSLPKRLCTSNGHTSSFLGQKTVFSRKLLGNAFTSSWS